MALKFDNDFVTYHSPKILKSPWILFVGLVVLSLQFLPGKAFAVKGGYDGGFYLLSEDEKFKFQVNLRVIPQYQYEYKETRLDTSTFQFESVRTFFKGHSFSSKVLYMIAVDYADGGASLKDAYVDLNIVNYFNIRTGQFYLPINREDFYSSFGSQMVTGSIVSGHFGIGRDRGLMLSGGVGPLPLNYYFFFTNGDGANAANKNKEIMTGTRLEYIAMGRLTGYQGDPDYSDSPNLGFGATALYDFGSAKETAGFQEDVDLGIKPHENRLVRGDLDGAFTWMGFNLLGQWQFVYNTRFRSFDHGYLTQAGFFIVPHKFEAAGRYAVVIPDFPTPALALTGLTKDNEGSPNPIHELAGGLNYYFKGDKLKLQGEYKQILNVNGIRNLNDQVVRAQLFLQF
ncbi:MAG: hypothetical protein HYW02_05395 [Deltaproteobacteria bacterium]|nr:hypothetical protein [Deltaproteobacteria bacterium]